MTYFHGQSEKKQSNHRCFSGFLRCINLDDHVKFLEISAEEEKSGLTPTIEKFHGVWFDRSERPPWQLIVINGRHVLLVFDHYITDGRGATSILASLQEALNSPDLDGDDLPIVELTTEVQGFPETDPVMLSGTSPFILWAIWSFLRFWCIRLFYRGNTTFFHDAKDRKQDFDIKDPKQEENRVITKLHTLRLSAETMQKCLCACRKHQTSFTSLLHTLIKVSLAADFYPDAKFSHSEVAIDIRPYLPVQERKMIMSTAVSMVSCFDWLSQFRQAGEGSDKTGRLPVNADLLWDLARKHKAHMVNDLSYRKTWKKAWLGIGLIGEDQEDYISTYLPGYQLVQDKSFSVSNVGAFGSSQSCTDETWIMTNLEFSASAIKAGLGSNLTFNVAGVRDSATVIHVSQEEGSFPKNFVGDLLKQIEKRIQAII
jgi:hypothetical protein